jgi:hypothetical protein
MSSFGTDSSRDQFTSLHSACNLFFYSNEVAPFSIPTSITHVDVIYQRVKGIKFPEFDKRKHFQDFNCKVKTASRANSIEAKRVPMTSHQVNQGNCETSGREPRTKVVIK